MWNETFCRYFTSWMSPEWKPSPIRADKYNKESFANANEFRLV